MKTKFLIFCFLLLASSAMSQLSQIVFESDTGSGPTLWSSLCVSGAVPIELTPLIDAQALYSGQTLGPVNVSMSGKWYTFQSERFHTDCNGWHCLTLADSAFSIIESVVDGSGNVIHNEGLSMCSSNGRAIIFSSDVGTHSRDIFIVHKIGNTWTVPKCISNTSAYDFNTMPRFSYNDTKVIFQGHSTSFPPEAVMVVDTNGSNLSDVINNTATVSGIVGCTEVGFPSFAPDGGIFFEGHWGGERIWHLQSGSQIPVLPSAGDYNDNSPVALPDGRVASLLLPNGTHDIKIQNSDGSGSFFLSGIGTSFPYDINDIGMGTGLANSFLTNIAYKPDIKTQSINVFPNPNEGQFEVIFDAPSGIEGLLSICTVTGHVIFEQKGCPSGSQNTIKVNLKTIPSGIYMVRFIQNNSLWHSKPFVVNRF